MSEVKRVEVGPNLGYFHHPHHRNGNPKKSQWTISEREELAVFNLALANNWISDNVRWGLHVRGGNVAYCGIDRHGKRQLVVAKFVSDPPTTDWHGYPADPHEKKQEEKSKEVPPASVLDSWLQLRLLGTAKLRKVGRGEPCSL